MLRPLIGVIVAAVTSLAAPSSAAAFDFKTPGEAAYCGMEFTARQLSAFRCITPNDGFWVRFNGLLDASANSITKGYSSRYRGYRERTQLLTFNRTWASSDAEIITCTSRASGLTCKNPPTGLTVWLGRYRGYRVYYTKPGYPLRVRAFFRTRTTWCGLQAENLAPENPSMVCWHPRTGVIGGIAHDNAGGGGTVSRSVQARGHRPPRYPLLRPGARFMWRCRSVDAMFAEGCGTASGTPVFTCLVTTTRVTCRNIAGRGFSIDNLGGFDTF